MVRIQKPIAVICDRFLNYFQSLQQKFWNVLQSDLKIFLVWDFGRHGQVTRTSKAGFQTHIRFEFENASRTKKWKFEHFEFFKYRQKNWKFESNGHLALW